MSHVRATLSREALLHNLSVVRSHCPTQKIWAMVKADAYGHGLQWVVDSLSDVDALGVATLEEALQLRSDKPVYAMRGFLNEEELLLMREYNIGAVLHCWEQIEILQSGLRPTGLPAPAGLPATPAGLPATPAGLPATPAGLPATPAGLPTTPAGLPTTPAGLPATPAGLPATPAGLPATPAGLPATPAGLPATPAGLPATPAGLPATPAGLPATPAGLPATPAGLSAIPAGLSAAAPTRLRPAACPRGLIQPAWIKIDTGMHRLGFQPEDIPKLTEILPTLPLKIEGWMTHLAKADEESSDMTQQQVRCFEGSAPIDAVKSIANSAGILAHPGSHADWVRPGLMLYGVSPFSDRTASELGLKPVMTLEAPVLSVKHIKAGEGVGYGQSWRASADTQVAIVGMGYGDGYPREAESARVTIAGVSYPVVGRVSMDLLAIDLQGDSVSVGSIAGIWGVGNPVEQLAAAAKTIPYTLLTRVTKRVEFKEGN